MNIELQDWLIDNKLDFEEIDELNFTIKDVGKFYHILPNEEGKIFDESFSLITFDQDTDYYCYSFGGKFYYETKDCVNSPKLNPLKYLGKAKIDLDSQFPYLGVHGKYELLNGSRDYKDWCKKANFLGITSLGICEKNTLAGIMPFQLACVKSKVTPILGMSASIKLSNETSPIAVKFYVINEAGWTSLLMIHKEISIVNSGFIYEKDLFHHTDGLICVVDPKTFEFDQLRIKRYTDKFEVYYQLDTVEYVINDRDKWYLENLKKFVNSGILEPILICDTYYLDKDEFKAKKILNSIASSFDYDSENQYFKNLDDVFGELGSLFNTNDDRLFDVFTVALENANILAEKCKFNINTQERHLPKYIMNPDEKERFKDNQELFYYYIEQGFNKIVPEGMEDEYMERLNFECETIEKGEIIDYFLITADVVRYCRNNGILVGHGRGSAAGSLVSAMLGITKVDPIKYDLLFERFLNPGRIFKNKEERFIVINDDHEFKENDKVNVIRNSKNIVILAKELIEGDDIV